MLKEDVEHHVKEEEGRCILTARLSQQTENLGAQMQARKDELESYGAPNQSSIHKRGGRSSNGKSKERRGGDGEILSIFLLSAFLLGTGAMVQAKDADTAPAAR